ncbi:putative leader peptide [Streptomyces sp. NBC_01190]|uniref:putative leader peptide n=1 Tax=Streptomyces sp. NBC_01190 TaxID=2903767 RepID=UPI00386ADC2E|nr:hypothetical protein OG519_02740 [Streptomyces sp. NBC_01190]
MRTQPHRTVRTPRHALAAGSDAFPPAAVRVLLPGGPVIRLYGRQHIDLLRVAGALCRR